MFQKNSMALNFAYNKNKLYETFIGYWFRDILNFGFLEKAVGIVSPPDFMYDFSSKMFLMPPMFLILLTN